MASVDSEEINFQLVSTYVPLILILLRSSVLIAVVNFVATLAESPHFMLLMLFSVVYFDAHLFRLNRFNQSCGFLCPVALCLALTHVASWHGPDVAAHASAALWAVDMAWAVSSSSFVAIVAFKGYVAVDVMYLAACWALCGLAHTLFAAAMPDASQSVLRAALYYVLCAVQHYVKLATVTVDRSVYKLAVGHVFWHVLLVKDYVLLGSIAACVLLFCGVYYVKYAQLYISTARPPPRQCSPGDDDALVSELRAAMNAASAV